MNLQYLFNLLHSVGINVDQATLGPTLAHFGAGLFAGHLFSHPTYRRAAKAVYRHVKPW